jgi:hypothetical protein
MVATLIKDCAELVPSARTFWAGHVLNTNLRGSPVSGWENLWLSVPRSIEYGQCRTIRTYWRLVDMFFGGDWRLPALARPDAAEERASTMSVAEAFARGF